MKKDRQWGLDILRILSMLGIVGLHILSNGDALQNGRSPLNCLFLSGMFVLCSCSVNIFAMLSGYLYAEKPGVRSVNLIKLLLITVIYSACIFVAYLLIDPTILDQLTPMQALFPALAGRYWYITSYVLLFVLIPYLNIMIRGMDRKHFRAMLLLLLVLLSVISTAIRTADLFGVKAGYTPLWLVMCYLVGAYIRLHQNETAHIRLWITILVISVAMLTVAHYFFGSGVIRLMDYNSPFMVLNASLLLLIFSRIRMKNMKMGKLILSLSGGAFGVYILHSHILIYDRLIAGNMTWIGQGSFIKCVGSFIGILVGIYLLCWLIDILRGLLFKWSRLDKLLQRLGALCDRLMKWDT